MNIENILVNLRAKVIRQRDSVLQTEEHIQALENLKQQTEIEREIEDSKVSAGKPPKK